MYQAKYLGGNCFQYYDSDMNSRSDERLELENALRHALKRSEFEIYYQPQIHNASGDIIGVEALIRWNHPQKGMLLPDSFIDLLEDNSLIIPIGEWVLRNACRQLKEWHEQGRPVPRVSVNVSARQLDDNDFPARVLSILDEVGLEPRMLELEITERSLIRKEKQVVLMLRQLSGLGISIAMDDFGTGYSSLQILQKLPVRTLKIDRGFLKNIPASQKDCSLASAIISMGKNLQLQVIAEGVETQEQFAYLSEQGCDITQGFYFSEPMTVANMSRFST